MYKAANGCNPALPRLAMASLHLHQRSRCLNARRSEHFQANYSKDHGVDVHHHRCQRHDVGGNHTHRTGYVAPCFLSFSLNTHVLSIRVFSVRVHTSGFTSSGFTSSGFTLLPPPGLSVVGRGGSWGLGSSTLPSFKISGSGSINAPLGFVSGKPTSKSSLRYPAVHVQLWTGSFGCLLQSFSGLDTRSIEYADPQNKP